MDKPWLQTRNGKIVVGVFVALAVAVMAWSLFGGDGRSSLENDLRTRWFIDEDGKAFRYEMTIGQTEAIKNPETGKIGYLAELCYWTKDGKVKAEPTPVLLTSYVGKTGPTFCPDCERLVVGHNPQPNAESPGTPPPTKAEYGNRRR